ncbi:leucyl aminopeptidase [Bartonella tamiae]|uniref:Probable cytosol aminopeptidase n=1 Tax=Bartonella tamiae Th239 TaxID=1094558 RepID=J1K0V1_9HYPH|nr:leucyl aminopeptidase [Bartonella tamiae]EJF90675.1 hypothetical protein ME5_01076 [Bartonella tamiae Th239]EJF93948.1 hypothetical protein MEG_00806 [Bartonella tamiae Th307]
MSKSIKIETSAISAPKKGTLVVLVNEKKQVAFEVEKIVGKALIDRTQSVRNFKAKPFTFIDTLSDNKKGFNRLVIMSVGEVAQLKNDDWLKLGGVARTALSDDTDATICLTVAGEKIDSCAIVDFFTGIYLQNYRFDTYKTNNGKEKKKKKNLDITIQLEDFDAGKKLIENAGHISSAIILARDLVNEPANVLGPKEFTDHVQKLKKLDVKVELLNEKDMEKLGMNALLGVARGSRRPPYLAIMHWQGGKAKEKPLAFVGKGVVFDSGGISLKPGAGMEDMKGDMGGAAAVAALMMVLASRKAPVNVVGVIGLVENMPDGDAQRPGDIIKSMSGQTIEVINTDAEGRLVLADALWYTKERFKPKAMINLATLTGAIIVALGTEHAGLFSNNDDVAQQLFDAGQKTGEKVWRMPLSQTYDKMVDSQFADMRNSCGRYAGSITAAQFLKRFVADIPWAHLDIAGTAMASPKNEYNQSWASGFGVRLLDRFVKDNYES